ncbi:MAG: EscU/YscU/HrcU family type III secretion system export apparatus switch protein, partial [Phycisphaerales bacterium]|nr:EscU/YscU/HrcU family type III secretion system export apparatus switch protein [Phycisphaerales bacterium]
ALVSMFLQVGWLFSLKPLRPNPGKLNPLTGLKRMFGPRAFVQLVMGVAKMSLLGLVAYMTIRDEINTLFFASSLHKLGILALSAQLVFRLGIRLALILLVLAIFDYIYQRHRTQKDIMMTKEEVKEEMKRMEGDPKVKQRRRQVQMDMAMRRIRAAVPKADVIITNPTELAIAIQYDAQSMSAPRVTAKGAGFLAQRIRELAIEHGVPIVERKPLAQALYKTVEVGQEIPAQFYRAVAEILAYVYELAGGRSSRAAAVGLN